MPQKRSTDGRHMRMLFAFMCYALLGTIIFSFLHYETVQNEVAQRRHKLDSLISKFAQKITEAANDPEKQVNVSTMKRYVEHAYAVLRDIDEGSGGGPIPDEIADLLS
ncbi:hypothetical protein Y032_0199g1668 [Ancylostoma ceylanicum]|uniref:Uncharacterized protein n=2 Tax=Ancylostoma ceylanicum TaxID=53326 RepID=A0A016SNS7_9BILA|nr:hypothetical protein Y032_0199g1668 [Ancylostoma ceylanicum]